MRFKSYRNKSTTSTTGLTRPLMPSTTTTIVSTQAFSLSRLKNILLCLSLLFILYLLFHQPTPHPPILPRTPLPTTRRHLLFSIASSSASWSRRKPFVRLWYSPDTTRAFVFLDKPVVTDSKTSLDDDDDRSVPPVIISADTSRFPYKFSGGLRSAIRVARVVKEIVDRGESDVRWFVFGDDDTVFFVDNLVKTLSKYDHEQWYYVGSNSESYDQNLKYSFDMAFGGGGFAISSSLAKALAGVFDSCLMRYAHLYGSDARVFSCLAELGVRLTHEPGFHQVDMRGNLFGMLSAHPLSPLVSLHHMEIIEPVFPNMTRTQALRRFFEASNIDPVRMCQQTVCYDSSRSLTVSVAWGYAIQVFEGNELLPDLLSVQKTFMPWRRSIRIDAAQYMLNTRDYPRDACKRPAVFFLESVVSNSDGIQSSYTRHSTANCSKTNKVNNLEQVKVFSKKLELDTEQMKAIRRQCCDILPSYNESMLINVRRCRVNELISMHV